MSSPIRQRFERHLRPSRTLVAPPRSPLELAPRCRVLTPWDALRSSPINAAAAASRSRRVPSARQGSIVDHLVALHPGIGELIGFRAVCPGLQSKRARLSNKTTHAAGSFDSSRQIRVVGSRRTSLIRRPNLTDDSDEDAQTWVCPTGTGGALHQVCNRTVRRSAAQLRWDSPDRRARCSVTCSISRSAALVRLHSEGTGTHEW
jgi:hypothetical protein